MANIVYTISLKDRVSKVTEKINKSFGKLKNGISEASNKIDNSFTKIQKKAQQTADRIKVTENINKSFGKLKNGVSGASNKIDNSFNKIQKKAQQTADKIKKSFNFSTITKAIAGLGAIEIGRNIIQKTADFEKYNAVLTNVFQSSKKAAEAQKMLSEVAAETPFELMEITKGYSKLAARGFAPTKKEMYLLGDVAAAAGHNFNMLAEAISDAQTFEFERLKEFNITSKQNAKAGTVEFRYKGVATKIKRDEESIRNYLLSLGKLTGVQGLMAIQSKTLGGAISNLKDSFDQLFIKIGSKASKGLQKVIRATSKFVTKFTKNFDKMFNSITKNAFFIKLKMIFTKTFNAVKRVFFTVKNEIVKTWQSISNFIESSPFMSGFIDTLGDAISEVGKFAANVIKVFGKVARWFTTHPLGKFITTAILTPLKIALSVVKDIAKGLNKLFGDVEAKANKANSMVSRLEKAKAAGNSGGSNRILGQMAVNEKRLSNLFEKAVSKGYSKSDLYKIRASADMPEFSNSVKIFEKLAKSESRINLGEIIKKSGTFTELKDDFWTKLKHGGMPWLETRKATDAELIGKVLNNVNSKILNKNNFSWTKPFETIAKEVSKTQKSKVKKPMFDDPLNLNKGLKDKTESIISGGRINTFNINIAEANGVKTMQISNISEGYENIGQMFKNVLLEATADIKF